MKMIKSTLKAVDTRCGGTSGAGNQDGHGGHAGGQQGWTLLLCADHPPGAWQAP